MRRQRWTIDCVNARGEVVGVWQLRTRRRARRFAAELASPLYSLVLHRTGDELRGREVLSSAVLPEELLRGEAGW